MVAGADTGRAPVRVIGQVLSNLRYSWPRILLFLAVAAVVGYLAIGPILYLANGTFSTGDGLTLQFFSDVFSKPHVGDMLWATVVFSLGSGLVATVLGTVLAFLVARTDIGAKSLLTALSLVPLILPGILHTVAWVFLTSPRIGVFNRILEPIFGDGVAVFNAQSMLGMIFVQGLHTAPLVFLLMVPAFGAMDPSLEESAAISGARVPTALRTITFPLLRPAILAGLLVSVVNGLEGFEVPLILGAQDGIQVLGTEVWYSLRQVPANYGEAGAYALLLVAVTMLAAYFYWRMSSRGKRFQTVTGKGFRPRQFELGRWRWLGTSFVVGYFFFAVAAPFLILLYASTQPFYSTPSLESLGKMSMANYQTALSSSGLWEAISNSLILAAATATSLMLLMAVAAWIVTRGTLRGRWIIDALAFAPIALPGVAVGVALIFIYLRSPLPIYGTLMILYIAYLTRFMPYGMRYAVSAMHPISAELEEASAIAGGRWLQTFRLIVLPLLIPGLLSGWVFVVIAVLRELSSSLLLYSPGNEVLSVVIWGQWIDGFFGPLAATGILMILILVALVFLSYLVARRFQGQSRMQVM